jgi:hypothetical protein
VQDKRPAALWTKPRVRCRSGRRSAACLYGFSSMFAVKPMPRRSGTGGFMSCRMAESMPAMASSWLADEIADGTMHARENVIHEADFSRAALDLNAPSLCWKRGRASSRIFRAKSDS